MADRLSAGAQEEWAVKWGGQEERSSGIVRWGGQVGLSSCVYEWITSIAVNPSLEAQRSLSMRGVPRGSIVPILAANFKTMAYLDKLKQSGL